MHGLGAISIPRRRKESAAFANAVDCVTVQPPAVGWCTTPLRSSDQSRASPVVHRSQMIVIEQCLVTGQRLNLEQSHVHTPPTPKLW